MFQNFEARSRAILRTAGKTAQITLRLGLPAIGLGLGANALQREISAQPAPQCLVVVDPIREQFYVNRGGPPDTQGRPQYDRDIDLLLGPAFIAGQPKREVLISASNFSFKLQVDADGIARRVTDPKNPNNRSSRVVFNAPCDTDQAEAKINGVLKKVPGLMVDLQSLVTGYNSRGPLAGNLENYTHPMYVDSQKPGFDTSTGPTVVPEGPRWAKTPVPAKPGESDQKKPDATPSATVTIVRTQTPELTFTATPTQTGVILTATPTAETKGTATATPSVATSTPTRSPIIPVATSTPGGSVNPDQNPRPEYDTIGAYLYHAFPPITGPVGGAFDWVGKEVHKVPGLREAGGFFSAIGSIPEGSIGKLKVLGPSLQLVVEWMTVAGLITGATLLTRAARRNRLRPVRPVRRPVRRT